MLPTVEALKHMMYSFFFFSCCQIENRNAYPEFVIFEAVQT